ncbi:MAG: peptide MFS transporter [Thiotrichales bacterium]
MSLRNARHPRGLYVLFFTEMWERFSYYGMRALLVLYLVNGMEVPRESALSVYAAYTALVYLTPILGGYFADRWLGQRVAVVIGGIVMALGHFAMAFDGLLYYGLGLVVTGNGFFKPNVSTMVGRLYEQDDPRRDGGFTIFYMGINLGAFLAPLVCGTLGEKLGWHYGFAAAGVGMLIGLAVFLRGQRVLGLVENGRKGAGLNRAEWLVIAAVSVLSVLVVSFFVHTGPMIADGWRTLSDPMRAALIIGVLGLILLPGKLRKSESRTPLSWDDYKRILAIFVLGVFVVFFWMGFEQAGGTMNLFADQRTDREILGWMMPASYFQSLNPLMILLLAPIFSIVFVWMDRTRMGLSAPVKMAMGMIILGLGFVVLAIADERAAQLGQVSPLWLVAVYLLHTVGELFLSPIGLSMVSRLAPVQLASLLMGVWFTAVAIANYLAGTLERLLDGSGVSLYWFLVTSSIGAGLVLLLLTPLLKYLMGNRA